MRLLSSFRAPVTGRVIQPTPPTPERPATVLIASGADANAAMSALRVVASEAHSPALVIPELAESHRLGTSPYVARAVLRTVSADLPTSIGIPRVPRATTERWKRLAAANDSTVVVFGDTGWVRLNLSDLAYRLTSIDLPAEAIDAGTLLALLRVERAREPFDFWPAVVHPHSSFRATAGADRDRLIVELAIARQATWIVDLTPGGGVSGADSTAILAVTKDVVAAELCVLAAQQLSWIRAGYEERGPWEHPRIQAACELGLGVSAGYAFVLRVRHGDDPAERLAERIARRLDCRVDIDD